MHVEEKRDFSQSGGKTQNRRENPGWIRDDLPKKVEILIKM
jgi:hypothetical protein